MKKKTGIVKQLIAAGLIAAGLGASSFYSNAKNKPSLPDYQFVSTAESNPNDHIISINEAPVYSEDQVPKNHCARYARIATEDLFGEDYPATDAWNMRYHTKATPLDKPLNQYPDGVIQPGMLVGCYNPKSSYLNKTDENGNKVKYTHILVVLGKDSNGEVHMAHKFGTKTENVTERDLRNRGLTLVEVLDNN